MSGKTGRGFRGVRGNFNGSRKCGAPAAPRFGGGFWWQVGRTERGEVNAHTYARKSEHAKPQNARTEKQDPWMENPECRNADSELGMLESRIRNPGSVDGESGIQDLESRSGIVDSGIQDP